MEGVLHSPQSNPKLSNMGINAKKIFMRSVIRFFAAEWLMAPSTNHRFAVKQGYDCKKEILRVVLHVIFPVPSGECKMA